MLTRLKVTGFKNLIDVDVRFGAFTCIAGANGVGKSNLFDAIKFLSALADRPLTEAALSVRDEGGRTSDLRNLFHRVGDNHDDQMSFEVEMIVPREGVDDLGQKADASINFLRYKVTLAYRSDEGFHSLGRIELIKEELSHIKRGEASKHLLFPHDVRHWRKSVLMGERRVPFFISTEGEGDNRIIKLHQDGGSSGRPLPRSATNLPRTVLSVANAAESPTAFLARSEMRSWRLLQLEPSSLWKPDEFSSPTKLDTDGSHLAATLYHLARLKGQMNGTEQAGAAKQVYGRVANRLAELIRDVHEIWVERDEKREILTLQVKSQDNTVHSARALSDGTLRVLALTVLELDSEGQGVLCLEEPENGVHPERIPFMLRLLQDIATDVRYPIDENNPLRQVIINTHSPAVVGQVPDDSLLLAETKEMVQDHSRFNRVCFSGLPDTWRTKLPGVDTVSRGTLLSYLNPIEPGLPSIPSEKKQNRRVVDRPDLQPYLSGWST